MMPVDNPSCACAVCVSAAVKLVLEAVCVLKGVKPLVGKDRETGQTYTRYWPAAQKMMMDEKEFMASLR